jgi:hypothetical protein
MAEALVWSPPPRSPIGLTSWPTDGPREARWRLGLIGVWPERRYRGVDNAVLESQTARLEQRANLAQSFLRGSSLAPSGRGAKPREPHGVATLRLRPSDPRTLRRRGRRRRGRYRRTVTWLSVRPVRIAQKRQAADRPERDAGIACPPLREISLHYPIDSDGKIK